MLRSYLRVDLYLRVDTDWMERRLQLLQELHIDDLAVELTHLVVHSLIGAVLLGEDKEMRGLLMLLVGYRQWLVLWALAEGMC